MGPIPSEDMKKNSLPRSRQDAATLLSLGLRGQFMEIG